MDTISTATVSHENSDGFGVSIRFTDDFRSDRPKSSTINDIISPLMYSTLP